MWYYRPQAVSVFYYQGYIATRLKGAASSARLMEETPPSNNVSLLFFSRDCYRFALTIPLGVPLAPSKLDFDKLPTVLLPKHGGFQLPGKYPEILQSLPCFLFSASFTLEFLNPHLYTPLQKQSYFRLNLQCKDFVYTPLPKKTGLLRTKHRSFDFKRRDF